MFNNFNYFCSNLFIGFEKIATVDLLKYMIEKANMYWFQIYLSCIKL